MAQSGAEFEQAVTRVLLQEVALYAAALPPAVLPRDLAALKGHADQIQRYAHGVPQLAMVVTDFFITRAELCHAIWARQVGHADDAEVGQRLAAHRASLVSLERSLGRRLSEERATSGEGAQSAMEALRRTRKDP